jgi:hypothetical protein
VLQRLYPEVLTLRHYLLSRLLSLAKNRKRRILQLGLSGDIPTQNKGSDHELGQLLDTTVVGVPPKAAPANPDDFAKTRDREIESFSQQLSNCSTGSTFKPGYFQQSEVGTLSPSL